MGNSSKKQAAKCNFLSKDEQNLVSNSFRFISKNSDRIKEDDLNKLWGSQIDPRLLQYINNYLFGIGEDKQGFVSLSVFAELYVFCTRGTVDEKFKVLLNSLGKSENDTCDLPYSLVKEYVESIVSSFMKIQKVTNGRQYRSWFSKGCFIAPQNIQRLAESLSKDLSVGESITKITLENWLQTCTLLGQLLLYVFNHLYKLSHKDKEKPVDRASISNDDDDAVDRESQSKERSLIPICRGLDLIPSYPSILDLNQIIFMNSNLPQEFQTDWRFLFSSEIHGESFSTLIGRIIDQGPTILVLEDKSGYIFGGFAPENWTLNPKFFGNDSSFLFTLAPRMRIFPSTGYNQHFQYLNLHQHTLPNGLAMGGQHGYCGFWLDSEYGLGHTSESCTTYSGYQQMSGIKEFQYRHLEVWGLGKPPTPSSKLKRGQSNERQIGHPESKALLKMIGRGTHSEGMEEAPPLVHHHN
ncbi:MTOR-associated protein MEAK7 [Harmonia axyridis]|uniref:MTOR-associated protein MEAK7 n=1 Tax=Harmonia axyridis TaxID=115357 RepID=UPI001E277607|nr:MTOR-associated protein MEAK7 [Harmonia axyridis]